MASGSSIAKEHAPTHAVASSISDAVDATEIELQPTLQMQLHLQPTLLSSSPPPSPKRTSTEDALPMPSPKVGPENFEKIRVLGAGSTGRVYLVRSVGLAKDEYYAMKVVKKSELVKRNRVQRVLTERQILSVANHPFVVTLHYCFQTAEYFYLVMQYCAGGELFSFLRRQENHRVSEAQARFYAGEVLIALEYLHLLGIIYRDLKPENILVHESGHVMLSDFDLAHEVKPSMDSTGSGSAATTPTAAQSKKMSFRMSTRSRLPTLSPTMSTTDRALWFKIPDRATNVVAVGSGAAASSSAPAYVKGVQSRRTRRSSCPCVCLSRATAYPHMDTESHMDDGEKRTSFVGTHEYVAPEIIAEEGYVGSVDWWAFGILLFEMLYGTTPFRGSTQVQTLENILDLCEDIEFPSDVTVSDECKDLIRRLLAKNVSKRLQNPLLIKSHPFFKGLVWSLIRHQQPPIVPTMVHSLQEKQFAPEEINAFDDEVPYHRAVPSPRRTLRSSSSSSTASLHHALRLEHQAAAASEAADTTTTAGGKTVQDPSPLRHSRVSSSTRTMGMSAYVTISQAPSSMDNGASSQKPDSSATTVKTEMTTPLPSPVVCAPPSPTPQGENAHTVPTSSVADVHDFEYVSNQQRGYWTSGDSHRSLTAKLSQMDMDALADSELRAPEEVDDEDELDEDEDYGVGTGGAVDTVEEVAALTQ